VIVQKQEQVKKEVLEQERLNNLSNRSVYSAQPLTCNHGRLSTSDFSAATWAGNRGCSSAIIFKISKVIELNLSLI